MGGLPCLCPSLLSWISFLLLGPRTVPSWEEASQVPRLPPPVHKTKVPLAMASSLFQVHELPSSYPQGSGPSTGSPEKGKQAMVYQERERGEVLDMDFKALRIPREKGGCRERGEALGSSLSWMCLSGADGLSSSRQLMEVSQLLRQYQARGFGALPAEDLLLYLKRLEHGGYKPGRKLDWGNGPGRTEGVRIFFIK